MLPEERNEATGFTGGVWDTYSPVARTRQQVHAGRDMPGKPCSHRTHSMRNSLRARNRPQQNL
eukprot:12887003-Prorocentrum_lima.AAC.1